MPGRRADVRGDGTGGVAGVVVPVVTAVTLGMVAAIKNCWRRWWRWHAGMCQNTKEIQSTFVTLIALQSRFSKIRFYLISIVLFCFEFICTNFDCTCIWIFTFLSSNQVKSNRNYSKCSKTYKIKSKQNKHKQPCYSWTTNIRVILLKKIFSYTSLIHDFLCWIKENYCSRGRLFAKYVYVFEHLLTSIHQKLDLYAHTRTYLWWYWKCFIVMTNWPELIAN